MRRFLKGYLAYSYDQATRPAAIEQITEAYRAELTRSSPRVSTQRRRLRPRIAILQTELLEADRIEWQAAIDDGDTRYGLLIAMVPDPGEPGAWLVTAVSPG